MKTLAAVSKVVNDFFDGVEVVDTPEWVVIGCPPNINQHGVYLALIQSGKLPAYQQYATLYNQERGSSIILVAKGKDE